MSEAPIDRIILALPAYDEAADIRELLDRAAGELRELVSDWRIIVVDDGSTDDTARIVEAAAEAEPAIRLVRHAVNRGLGPALMTCLSEAAGESSAASTLIVTMDADNTHPPEVIGSMIEMANEGFDLIIASRFQPGSRQVGLSPLRRLLSFGARTMFTQVVGIPGVRDYTCGFRAFRADLIARALELHGPDTLLTRAGFACADELLIKLALMGPYIAEVPFILRYDLKRSTSKIDLGVTIGETLRLAFWARRELFRRERP